jgi:RNA polymerase sigma factor (sigma-70 family)
MSSMLDLPPALPERGGEARVRQRAVPPPDAAPLDFDDVVRRLTPRLQRYATRRLGDRHEAEELVQEALLRAFDHREELRTEEDVAAWSTCVTGRLVIDRLRVRGRGTSVAQVPEGSRVGRDTAEVVVARDEARLALDALDAMPARQAAVLWAREVEGLSYEEIGTRFAMTEPAVRSLLTRARKALRKEFVTRGGTLPAGGLVALAPWLDALPLLDRLRRLAARAAAPAAVGAASLGLLGGVLVAPWTGTAPAPRPAVVDLAPHDVAVARAPLPALARAAAVPPVPPGAGADRPAPPPTSPRTVLHRTGVTATCVDGAGATAGGRGCDLDRDAVLHVGPALPANPTGVERVGVESDRIDCAAVPDLPLTECTPEGDFR